ncbi:hypothetical protein [Streptomyces sp. NPDC001404]|uniref:hypothetical protein n=1 Tax=Streptomyces sp. NPDC001404 TaxID=3364571 RepID=UPI003696AF33
MFETRTRRYDITVFAADGDLAWFGTADTAPAMEDLVTDLHKRFPAPQFRVEVTFG